MVRRTDEEVIRDGLAVLGDGLGLADSLRFVRLTFRLEGDYTANRAEFVDLEGLERDFDGYLESLRVKYLAAEAARPGHALAESDQNILSHSGQIGLPGKEPVR